MPKPPRSIAAFTLVELLIGMAIIAIIVTLAVPSFRDMILMQRLRGVNAQLVTDISFARAEAVSRASFVQVRFQNIIGSAGMSCYIIHTRTNMGLNTLCDCTAAEGSRCLDPTAATEIRTVQLPNTQSVFVMPAAASTYTIDPRTGGMMMPGLDGPAAPNESMVIDTLIDSARKFRNLVAQSGRVSVCQPLGSRVGGVSC